MMLLERTWQGCLARSQRFASNSSANRHCPARDRGPEGVDAVARYWSANVMVTLADISV